MYNVYTSVFVNYEDFLRRFLQIRSIYYVPLLGIKRKIMLILRERSVDS